MRPNKLFMYSMNLRLILGLGVCFVVVIAHIHGEDPTEPEKPLYWRIVDPITPHYGNYCGPGWTYGGPDSLLCPIPVNKVDSMCAVHDILYKTTVDPNTRAEADIKLASGFLTSGMQSSLYGFAYTSIGSLILLAQADVSKVMDLYSRATNYRIDNPAEAGAFEKTQAFLSGASKQNSLNPTDASTEKPQYKSAVYYKLDPPFKDLSAVVNADREAYSKYQEDYNRQWDLFVENSNRLWNEWYTKWEAKKTYKTFKERMEYLSAFSDDYKIMRDKIEAMRKELINELESKRPKSHWPYLQGK